MISTDGWSIARGTGRPSSHRSESICPLSTAVPLTDYPHPVPFPVSLVISATVYLGLAPAKRGSTGLPSIRRVFAQFTSRHLALNPDTICSDSLQTWHYSKYALNMHSRRIRPFARSIRRT